MKQKEGMLFDGESAEDEAVEEEPMEAPQEEPMGLMARREQ
jgi:hypothetical protein